MVQQEAVVVRNARKCYVKGKPILDGMSMTVRRGSIYGLLGASGCGKTTLLSCVVGVRYLDSGDIWVLGGKPGSKGSGIPGPRVGYMPQDISLVGEFTVKDALFYFGRINGLTDEEIETRRTFFSEMLQLPPADRMVKNMSGGQQRRVSFAASLIHKPELLILDEPTVGLDSILRESIWIYLSKITREEGTTVVITTHYIEETKDANRIGLMRRGQLLAESAPQELLDQFECSLLEDAFLKLCEAQDAAMNEAQGSRNIDSVGLDQDLDAYKEYKPVSEQRNRVPRLKRFNALLAKNGIQFLRYYTGLLFAVLFPIIQTGVFFIGVGGDPKDLKIGIVNDEAGNCDYGKNIGNVWNDEITCHFGNLSCRFLQFDDYIAEQVYYNDIFDATDEVQDGEISGIIHFNQNFSQGLQARVEESTYASDSDLLASVMEVYLDMGDRQIGLFIQQKLFERFMELYEDVMRECNYSTKLADPPIRFEEPVYGSSELDYADFMAPAYMLSFMFYLAVTISTTLMITDRLEGVWERSLVQGVKTEEILVSHIIVQCGVILIHTTITMFLYFPIWGLTCEGSIVVAILFVFLAGFTGLMYGFVISVFCNNHTLANQASAGSFFPLMVLNGCLWPLEGMPGGLSWLAYSMPTTMPSLGLRAVIYKGYAISDSEVYNGIFVNLGWIIFFFMITVLGLRLKT